MNKALYSLIFIQLILSYGCQNSFAQNNECVKSFSEHIHDIDTGEIVNFKKIDCFSWDSLLIIAPAFGKERVEEYSGIELPSAVNYSWMADGEGNQWFILFIHNNEVVDYFSIQRNDLDFSLLRRIEIQTPEDFFFIKKSRAKFSTYSNGEEFVGSGEEVIWAKFE